MKKFLILFFIFSSFSKIYAYDDTQSYALYQKQLENFCKNENTTNKVTYNTGKYLQAEKYQKTNPLNDSEVLDTAISKYKSTMNSIYRCAIINAQRNSITNFKKSVSEGTALKSVLDTQESKLKILSEDSSCKNISTTTLNKQNILNQTTYETCSYTFYMEYLKKYYDNYTLNGSDKKEMTIQYYASYKNLYTSRINYEIDRAFKLFPIAYKEYISYENYYPIHFLLLLIKQDFFDYRQAYHNVINPINQVVYKISNAMKVQ